MGLFPLPRRSSSESGIGTIEWSSETIPKPYSPLPIGQPINGFAPNGELGFILILRLERVCVREHFQLSVAVGSGDAGSEVHGECFTALVLATLEKRKNYKGDKNANSALDFAVG